MNKVYLLGNLGEDPELKQTQSSAVLRIRMATTRVYYDKSNKKQENTQWHSVQVWGNRAEGLAKILSKGDRVLVEGEIEYSTSEDRDGNKKYFTNIRALNVELCGGRGGGGRDRDDDSGDDRRGRRDRGRREERRERGGRDERRERGRDEGRRQERKTRPADDDKNPDWGMDDGGDTFGGYGD